MVYFLLLSSRCRLTLYDGNDSSELTTLWSRYLMLLVGFSEKNSQAFSVVGLFYNHILW
jgi:hypothetical protein